MYDQAPINRIRESDWKHHVKDGQETGGVRQLIADITELAELQARLIADDVRLTAVSVATPIILLLVALVITLGLTPVLVLAGANLLVEQVGWSQSISQFVCLGLGLLVVITLGILAVRKLKNLALPLKRSVSELEKNLAKMREMLVGKDEIVERFERRDPPR